MSAKPMTDEARARLDARLRGWLEEWAPEAPPEAVDVLYDDLAAALAAARAEGEAAGRAALTSAEQDRDDARERVRRLEASIDVEQATNALEDMGHECIELSKRAEQAEAENARLTAERDEARGSANKLRGHLEAALKRWRTWRERARQAEAENARLQERVRRLEASIDIEQATDALEDMGNECIEKSSQIEALQAALEQAAVALSRYATWPNDDIGGLRYHAMQDAKAARQQALKGGA